MCIFLKLRSGFLSTTTVNPVSQQVVICVWRSRVSKCRGQPPVIIFWQHNFTLLPTLKELRAHPLDISRADPNACTIIEHLLGRDVNTCDGVGCKFIFKNLITSQEGFFGDTLQTFRLRFGMTAPVLPIISRPQKKLPH